MLADAFETFQNMSLVIYELDPAKFLPPSGLALHGALKKTKVILDLLTSSYMLLMLEKGIREGIRQSVYRYKKITTNTWKIMIKIKNSHILIIWI